MAIKMIVHVDAINTQNYSIRQPSSATILSMMSIYLLCCGQRYISFETVTHNNHNEHCHHLSVYSELLPSEL